MQRKPHLKCRASISSKNQGQTWRIEKAQQHWNLFHLRFLANAGKPRVCQWMVSKRWFEFLGIWIPCPRCNPWLFVNLEPRFGNRSLQTRGKRPPKKIACWPKVLHTKKSEYLFSQNYEVHVWFLEKVLLSFRDCETTIKIRVALLRGVGRGGREENCLKSLLFPGKHHDNEILKVQVLLSRNVVVIAQAPIPEDFWGQKTTSKFQK